MHEDRKRGRPRPAETVALDEAVWAALVQQASRDDLAAHFRVTPHQMYLSLRRLHKAGRVETVRRGNRHFWTQTSHV